MRLYLSSYRLGGQLEKIRRRGTLGRAGIIVNAQDGSDGARDANLAQARVDIAPLGYVCKEIDLRDYFGHPDALASRLAALDMVWVTGGNVFVLARAMGLAGFRAALDKTRANFIYAGYSAGACVAGPDLLGLDKMDNPSLVPDGYTVVDPVVSLDLTRARLIPHWASPHPESAAAAQAADMLRAAELEYYMLRDGEAVVIDVAWTPLQLLGTVVGAVLGLPGHLLRR